MEPALSWLFCHVPHTGTISNKFLLLVVTIEFNIIILTAQYMVYHNKVVSCIFHITITLKYWF